MYCKSEKKIKQISTEVNNTDEINAEGQVYFHLDYGLEITFLLIRQITITHFNQEKINRQQKKKL